MKDQTNYLKELISKGETEEVIISLLKMIRKGELLESRDLQNEVMNISSRFEKLKRDRMRGVISSDKTQVMQSKLDHALLGIIQQLGSSETTIKSRTNKLWRLIIATGVIIGIIGGIAEFSGFSLKDVLLGESSNSITQTIYLHGPNGRQDIVLENAGNIIIDIGNRRMVSRIGENGRTVFGEFPRKFIGEEFAINLDTEGFETVNPDTTYSFSGVPIYVEIKELPQNNNVNKPFENEEGEIRGFVRTIDGNFISNVEVLIDDNLTSTTTDTYGYFELQIPKDQSKKIHRIRVTKVGYLTYEALVPVTDEPIMVRLRAKD